MNGQERKDLTTYRLTKAKETIADVELLIKLAMWDIAVNRLYYACYYAVSALLIDSEIYSRTHSGTRQMFGLHFISTGKIQKLTGDYYSKIFTYRHKGDYEDFWDFEEKDVVVLVAPAKALIGKIEELLINGR
jgi:uncharacterized protein (UPF0332 family)